MFLRVLYLSMYLRYFQEKIIEKREEIGELEELCPMIYKFHDIDEECNFRSDRSRVKEIVSCFFNANIETLRQSNLCKYLKKATVLGVITIPRILMYLWEIEKKFKAVRMHQMHVI